MTLPVLFFLASIIGGGSGYPVVKASAPAKGSSENYILHTSDPDVHRAGELLNRNQPSQALEVLQATLERHQHDADVLLLAGLAAYRSDQLVMALEYWKESLDLAPNDALSAIYSDAQREAQVDRSSDRLESPHIALRFESAAITQDTASSILLTLEQDYSRISAELGCSTGERIIAIVQNREQYVRASGAAVWSGGHYDGRIHVALTNELKNGQPEIGPRIERALAHEMTHACLASIPSGSDPWPTWLQEGLAQELSGDTLGSSASAELETLISEGKLPPLERLGTDWFCLSEQEAVAAYRISLAAVDVLYHHRAGSEIRTILSDPESLPMVTADLDARLGL